MYLMTPLLARAILAVRPAKVSEDCLPTHAGVARDIQRRWLNLRKLTITLSMLKQTVFRIVNSVTMADMRPNVDTTSQMDGESGADSSNPSIAVRPVVSRKSQPAGHISATCISSDQCQSYDPKLHRKLHHNSNPFIIRRYDSRIKKCRGCGNEFKCDTARPKLVIVHKELSVYVRVNDTKHILTIPRDVFYHCNPACIQPAYRSVIRTFT